MTRKQQSKKQQPQSSRRLRVLDVAIISLALGLVAYGIWQSNAPKTTADSMQCAAIGREYQVALANDAFSQPSITVNRCDRLVISNQGQETYDLMLGTRDNHVNYPGFTGQILRPGEYFTFDAVKTGQYPLHDHTRDNAKLQITINQ